MPLRPKYRPNRHLEPLYDSHFSVMEVLRETPSETSPPPMEGQAMMGEDFGTYQDIAEELLCEERICPKSENDTLITITEPSLESLPEDVLIYIQNLKESNDSLQKDLRASNEENAFKIQFCERLQASNNECIDLIVELKNKIRYLESFGRSGQNTQAGEIRRCVLDLKAKKEECSQLYEDLDRFDKALKDSQVKVSLLESDLDFYKNEVGCLQKTIRELRVNQNGLSVGQKTRQAEALFTSSIPEGSAGIPTRSPVKSTSPPEASGTSTPLASTPKPSVASGSCVQVIPKLDLSEIGFDDTELSEPIRTREADSPIRPKAPNLATAWNGASCRDLVDPFSYKSKVTPLKKTKMIGIPRPPLPPVKLCPGGQIHRPKIVRGSDDFENKSSARRRAIILPSLNAKLPSSKEMKTPKPSSCVLLPPLQKQPALSKKREPLDTNKKRGFH